MKNTRIKIKTRQESDVFGFRIPKPEANILRRTAKKYRCKCADLLRTAWSEFIANHAIEEAVKPSSK